MRVPEGEPAGAAQARCARGAHRGPRRRQQRQRQREHRRVLLQPLRVRGAGEPEQGPRRGQAEDAARDGGHRARAARVAAHPLAVDADARAGARGRADGEEEPPGEGRDRAPREVARAVRGRAPGRAAPAGAGAACCWGEPRAGLGGWWGWGRRRGWGERVGEGDGAVSVSSVRGAVARVVPVCLVISVSVCSFYSVTCVLCSPLLLPAPRSRLLPRSVPRRVGREPVCRRAGPDVIYATPRYRPLLSAPRPSRCPLLSRAPTHKIRYSSHPGGADVIHARRARRASITRMRLFTPSPSPSLVYVFRVFSMCYSPVRYRATASHLYIHTINPFVLSRPSGPVLLSPPPRPLRPHDPRRCSPQWAPRIR